jgi:sulfotransferase family protein
MGKPPQSEWPIIVGGCHRSGTSLVRRILDSHSRIHCGPEVKFFADFYGQAFPDSLRAFRYIPTARSLASAEDLLEVLGRGFVELHERAGRDAGKARWADKAPENVLYCSDWQRLLGDRWLLVHVVRNPLDTIASLGEARFFDVPLDLAGRVQHYIRYMEAGLRFAADHPERYWRVIYEDLIARPEAALARLMDSLGESMEPQQMALNREDHRPGLEDPKVLATTEIHGRSVHRWRSMLGLDDAELVWDLTSDLWSKIDPHRRFVDPPPEPLRDADWPRADQPARHSSMP